MNMTPNDDNRWRAQAREALIRYALDVDNLEHIPQGLINLTVRLTTAGGERYILQRLHPVFDDAVNHNLAAVTDHLARHGLLTPRLVHTRDGACSVTVDGRLWRVLTYIDGRAVDALEGQAQARAAGATLAQFHVALRDFSAPLIGVQRPVHDFPRHLAHLERTCAEASGHRLSGAARKLGAELNSAVAALPAFTPGADVLVHGDPKVSNILFAPPGLPALCLIDLDTIARMPLCLELGDAMRSWCNTEGEDAATAQFDLDLFAAAVAGYASTAGSAFDLRERARLVPATLRIQLELAARFLADALEERYFGWNAERYDSAGAHNLARARGQLAVAGSLLARLEAAQAIAMSGGGT